MFGFLPGGSPGPNAEGSWKVVLFIFILVISPGGLFPWVWRNAVEM